MLIISGFTKVFCSVVLVLLPTTSIAYQFLPENLQKASQLFTAFAPKPAYFLVSKTHPVKGSFYYEAPKGNNGSKLNQLEDYKKQFKSWKVKSSAYSQSTADLLTEDGKKNYKCHIPINVKDKTSNAKAFDVDCQVYSIKDVSKTSEIFSGSKLFPIQEKLHITYSDIYLLEVNLNNIYGFTFVPELIVDILEKDAETDSGEKHMFSLSMDNKYDSSDNTWYGKINTVLYSTSDKNSSNTISEHSTKKCKKDYWKTDCLAFKTGDSNPMDYSKSTLATNSSDIEDNKQLMVRFLSTKFVSPISTRLKYVYEYIQICEKTKEEIIIKLTKKDLLVGFVDFDDNKNTTLFTLDNPKQIK